MAKLPQNFENSGEPKIVNFLMYVMAGIIIVMFVGFIAMIIAYITILIDVQGQKLSYQDLLNKFNDQKMQQNLIYGQLEKSNADMTKVKTYFGIK